ncbi:MMPL family transporter [Aeromicrobium sp. CF4.19]|uniref:MMPL family transporter n=1 Tax=Aeromicrobium sp. CF4.19 TaxID=3373082 RepID=UPI003EE62C8E
MRAPAALVGPRRSWLVVLLAIVVAGLALVLAPEPSTSDDTASNLPSTAESAQAADALQGLDSAEDVPAIVVLSREDALRPDDLGAAEQVRERLADLATGEVVGPVPADDGTAALLVVPLPQDTSDDENAALVEDVRDVSAAELPEGLRAEVTGPPAFQADLGAVFEGADVRLLVVTASVVALLLLFTYRSPWLWLVPLSVVGVADRTALAAADTFSAASGVGVDGAITGITSVLVFGAGTNYALLLIARYREELRRHEGRHEAMRRAVSSAGPAILASSGTVILALLALGLADAPFVQGIGFVGAIGLAVAVAFALLVLPSAMVLPGRWLFWPFVPRAGQADPSRDGAWARLGRRVVARPVPVALVSTVVLAAMAAAALGLQTGLAQTEQFRDAPESVVAQERLAESFPAGFSSPTRVATSIDAAEDVVTVAEDAGAESARVAGSDDTSGVAEVEVVLAEQTGSVESLAAVEELRTALDDVDPEALVGGEVAEDLDSRTTAQEDRTLLIPVVLAIVLAVLLLLLRSIVAALVLTSTTVLSYVSALGIGWLVFEHWLGFPAMDLSVPLLAFIFLVALGVDYNIFLTTRAREEVLAHGDTRRGIVDALAVTGGVITSAGILLAAVFAVLGVLPLLVLTQVGVIVGFGVLLDTTVVRSILVPALVALLGDRFWWPSRMHHRHRLG